MHAFGIEDSVAQPYEPPTIALPLLWSPQFKKWRASLFNAHQDIADDKRTFGIHGILNFELR